jgi:AraC family transcriptional regulator
MTNTGILNELSEFVSIRMKSMLEHDHDDKWLEHKSHIDYDLWFIRSGSAAIVIDGKEHIAAEGDIVFFYPGLSYSASARGGRCRLIFVHFDFEIGRQRRILDDFPLSGIVPGELVREEAQWFARVYRQMVDHSDVPGSRLYLKACLTAVVARIIELNGIGVYCGSFKGAGKSERNLETFKPVFDYIHQHLHQSIRMHELASIAGVSEKYFITSFRKALGITPGQYIYQIRMNRARELLNSQRYSIQQIAALLGYPDLFTFSKAFKKYYDIAPSKFQ